MWCGTCGRVGRTTLKIVPSLEHNHAWRELSAGEARCIVPGCARVSVLTRRASSPRSWQVGSRRLSSSVRFVSMSANTFSEYTSNMVDTLKHGLLLGLWVGSARLFVVKQLAIETDVGKPRTGSRLLALVNYGQQIWNSQAIIPAQQVLQRAAFCMLNHWCILRLSSHRAGLRQVCSDQP